MLIGLFVFHSFLNLFESFGTKHKDDTLTNVFQQSIYISYSLFFISL